MSQKPSAVVPPVPTRPYLLDYFFLLCGFALSLYLLEWHALIVEPPDSITNSFLRAWIMFLPRLLRLPEGVTTPFSSVFPAAIRAGPPPGGFNGRMVVDLRMGRHGHSDRADAVAGYD